MSDRIRLKLSEGVTCLQGIGAAEPEAAAVDVIAARLGLCGYDACYGLAKFGVIILQCNLSLRHRVQVRIYHNNSQNRILVVRSIQFVCGAAKVLPLDKNLLAALRIFRGGVTPPKLLGSVREQFKTGEVSIQNRQIFDVLRVEFDGHVGAVGLQLRGFSGYFDMLAGRADLKLAVDVGGGVSVDDDIFELEDLEALTFNPHVVDVGDQVRNGVITTLIGGRFDRGVLGLASDRDFYIGHSCPGG